MGKQQPQVQSPHCLEGPLWPVALLSQVKHRSHSTEDLTVVLFPKVVLLLSVFNLIKELRKILLSLGAGASFVGH